MMILKNFPLKQITTMAIGGPAKFFVTVRNENQLINAINAANDRALTWCIIGEGSNLIVSDSGYRGVVIKNEILAFRRQKGRTFVGGGNNLLKAIFRLNRLGLGGMERMAGIPGTVGGAIYGCAGAYGQEIKDHLVRVKVWDGNKFRILSQAQCQFGYRKSVFKKQKKWVVVEAEFKLQRDKSAKLQQISRETMELRKKKYWPGLKCPGSFFKNIKLSDVRPASLKKRFVKKINPDRIMYGKVPVGYLLDEVGAKELRSGGVSVASHHANLIYNRGGGKAQDVKKLALKLKTLVRHKFGLFIEEEVQYI